MATAQEEGIRYARVLEHDYRFDRIETPEAKRPKPVAACWEAFIDPLDLTSRAGVTEFYDGTCEAWAMPGVYTTFAGAAAIELVIRLLQRENHHAKKQFDQTKLKLVGIVVPAVGIVGVLVGYVFGAM